MADEDNNWQYSPGGDSAVEAKLSEAVDDELKKPARKGSGSISWQASEYIDHKQGASWFLALAAATIVIAGASYLITKDIFVVIILVLLGVSVGIFAHRTPQKLDFELSQDGLMIGKKSYPFSLFKSYSIIKDGALLSLNLSPIKRFMPPVSAYFDAADQEKINSILEDHLPYQNEELDFIERATRRLRF